MEIIISNIVVWTSVLIVLWNLKIKVAEKRQEAEGYEKGFQSAGQFDDDRYIIEYGRGLKITMTIGVVFFAAIFFVNYATYFWGWNIGQGIDMSTVVFFGIALLFYMATFSGIVIWRVKVYGDDIYYRNCLGIVKKYKFSELDKVYRKKNHKIIVYDNDHKIFSIDNNLTLGAYFIISARKYKVKIETE